MQHVTDTDDMVTKLNGFTFIFFLKIRDVTVVENEEGIRSNTFSPIILFVTFKYYKSFSQ